MRIVFIGSGNIAHFFIPRLQRKGHDIVQIYSPTPEHALALATRCGVKSSTDDLAAVVPDADVYVLAVKDDALPVVAEKLHLPGKVVIHCAGAVSLDVTDRISEHRAVIWALYSIKKNNLPQANNIPLIVETNSPQAREAALRLAGDMSETVLETDLVQRRMLHLNAVLVNNFTNHLFTIAQQLGTEYGLPFEVLYPIISQTFGQVQKASPGESQTGPAVRRDQATIEKHIDLLKAHPAWQKVYADITVSIQESFPVKD